MIFSLLAIPIILRTATAASSSSANPGTATISPVIPPQPIVTYIPPASSPEAPVTRIFKYNGVGFENLAFRTNGQILATTAFPWALLFYIDPLSIRPGIVLHNFTASTSTAGITELAPDMFYFAAGGAVGVPSRLYSIDMRPLIVLPNGTIFKPPIIKEVASIPSALLLNGVTSIRRSDSFVLVADTLLGGVWKIHVNTGKYELIIQDPSMAGPANQTAFAAFGINGLRVQNGTLFYCNSGAQSFYRMPLRADGSSAGKAVLITTGIACDDFALDPWGFAYVASPRNALIKLDTRTGTQLVVAGTFNESVSDIISASSARFGVGDSDRSSMYVTTNGGAFVGAPLGSQGISRVDVGDLAWVLKGSRQYM